jgi:hypothetical protein
MRSLGEGGKFSGWGWRDRNEAMGGGGGLPNCRKDVEEGKDLRPS